jgi:hypothetical protein
MTLPIAPIIGLLAGIIPAVGPAMAGNYMEATNQLGYRFLGVSSITSSPRFDINGLKTGLAPLVAGLLVHKFVGGRPLGLNAVLGKARVPYVRI